MASQTKRAAGSERRSATVERDHAGGMLGSIWTSAECTACIDLALAMDGCVFT